MSNYGRPAGSAREYPPKIEEIAEQIGENPARYLDQNLVETGPSHTTSSGRPLFIARVRGIDYIGVANAWIIVERELAKFRDREPRQRVIELLERRRDHLIENGERTDLSDEELQRRREELEGLQDDEDDVEVVWRHAECGTTDVERENALNWYCHTCDLQTNRVERVDDEELVDAETESLTNVSA